MLDERLGKVHFWFVFVGFHTTFLIQHWLGVMGMPRRYADYLACRTATTLNDVSTIGSSILGVSTLIFLWNVYKTWKHAPRVTVDDPWGWGNSLEWATSCPPPRHNFTSIPRIRSERPAFDLHHPHVQVPAATRPAVTAGTAIGAGSMKVEGGSSSAARSSSAWPRLLLEPGSTTRPARRPWRSPSALPS